MRSDSSLRNAIVNSAFLATALLCLLSGCAATGDNRGGQGPAVEDLGKLVPGTTTTSQVRELLGPPRRVARLDRQQRDVWEYRRYVDPMDEHLVAVQFSPDGIVREVLMLKDFSREPCGQ